MLSEFRACPRIGFQFPIIFLFGWGAPIVAQGVMGDFVQQEEREKEIRFSSSSEARGRIEPAEGKAAFCRSVNVLRQRPPEDHEYVWSARYFIPLDTKSPSAFAVRLGLCV